MYLSELFLQTAVSDEPNNWSEELIFQEPLWFSIFDHIQKAWLLEHPSMALTTPLLTLQEATFDST